MSRETQVIYAVYRYIGSYDDYEREDLFATTNKLLAERFCRYKTYLSTKEEVQRLPKKLNWRGRFRQKTQTWQYTTPEEYIEAHVSWVDRYSINTLPVR